MKAKASPLKLTSFLIFENFYKFIEPELEEVRIKDLFDQYEIEIDFAHFSLEDDFFECRVRVEVNKSEGPGYTLGAEGIGIFRLELEEDMEEDVKKNLRNFSSVSIVINCIRNLFSHSTANAPMGRYILPAIDLQSLFRDKRELGESLKTLKR